MSRHRATVDRRALGTLYAGFVLVGVATVLPGPLIPELREAWNLSHAHVAVLFPAFFVASGLGSVLSDWNLRLGLLGGYTMISIGLAGLAFATWPLPAVAIGAVGLGVGLVAPGTNFLVAAAAAPGRRSSDLATLNLVWGIGATGCPLILAALVHRVPTQVVLLGFAALSAVVLVALLSTLEVQTTSPKRDADSIAGEGTADRLSPLATASLWPIAAMIFVYVGIESSVAGWVVSLSEALDGARSVTLVAHAAFWGLLLTGRGLTPIALRYRSDRQVYAGGWLLAALGTLTFLVVDSPAMVAAAAGLCGLGLGPIFPLTVSFLAERLAGGRSGGWVFAFAGFGGAVVPWIAGRVAEVSDVQTGFWVPTIALAALITIFAGTRTSEAV